MTIITDGGASVKHDCASITVFRTKYAKGWPDHAEGTERDRAYVVPVGKALEGHYPTDAHFAAYRTHNARRLNRGAIDTGVAIELTVTSFDLDAPGHVASRDWREETRAKVRRLAEDFPDPYYYETRGGARVLYLQAEPTVIRSQDDAAAWSRAYTAAVAHLGRVYGLVADPACCDWQRLYRLPRTVREPGGRRENLPIWGRPDRIGTMLLKVTHEDVAVADAQRPHSTGRARQWQSVSSIGTGLLYWLLSHRGDIGRACSNGWIARCPNRAQHTSDTDGTTSTIVTPPGVGEELGLLLCKHAHCSHIDVRGWLEFFTTDELSRARESAGIGRAA